MNGSEGPCRWCGEPVPPKLKPGGRRREFCGQTCLNKLHGRRRWLQVHRERLEGELAQRQAAVPTARDRAGAESWVASFEGQIARVDEELASLDAAAPQR